MLLFDNLGKKIGDMAQTAVKKSEEMVEITKLNLNVNSEEDSIKKLYSEIGKYCFEKYEKGNENDDTIVNFCEKIKGHKDSISELKEKIAELKQS